MSGLGSIQSSNFVLNKTILMFIQSLTIWLRKPKGHCLFLPLHCMEHTEHLTGGIGCKDVCALHLKLQNRREKSRIALFKVKENPKFLRSETINIQKRNGGLSQ